MHFVINLLPHLEWGISALIALALCFGLGISSWWLAGGLALWILRVLFGMWIWRCAAGCGAEKDPPKENKNPYSVRKGKENLK